MRLLPLMSLFPSQRELPTARFIACRGVAFLAFAEIRELDYIVSLEEGIWTFLGVLQEWFRIANHPSCFPEGVKLYAERIGG